MLTEKLRFLSFFKSEKEGGSCNIKKDLSIQNKHLRVKNETRAQEQGHHKRGLMIYRYFEL